jgi:hypothetical protein
MDDNISKSQRQNLLNVLESDLRQKMDDESLTFDNAFVLLALDYLEFNPDNGELSGGKGDHGIDYWEVDEEDAAIFQFKSHDFTENFDPLFKIGTNDLDDIRQLKQVLLNLNNIPDSANKSVKKFLQELTSAIVERKLLAPEGDAEDLFYNIDINFVALANNFTQQAKDEFDRLQMPESFYYEGVKVNLQYTRYFIDDLLESRWAQQNSKWKNRKGESQDKIEIKVVKGINGLLSNSKWCVFFGKAIDLVKAFEQLGYQIFEPNVRCELKTSKINIAIKETLKTSKGRKEFHHLNNGITMKCDSFQKPSQNKEFITILKPGVINGLQTVKALYDAFKKMADPQEKKEFIDETSVLIRLHWASSVYDINQLIKSTNNQNPMQPRNLKSNDIEQVQYQNLFGKLGWFYARKEREWDAFTSHESAWIQLKGKKKSYFKVSNGYKKVDNLDVAQAYFSLTGFTTEAMQRKKDLFSNDELYEIIFKRRARKHGSEYGYSFSRNKELILADAIQASPSPELMLMSYISRVFAKEASPDQKSLREKAIKKLNLESKSNEEIGTKIIDDTEYVKGYILRGTPFIFVELIGYILYKAFGPDCNGAPIKNLLNNQSTQRLVGQLDCNYVKNITTQGNYEYDDLIVIIWKLYEHIIELLVEDTSWHANWKAQSNLSQFHYSEANRKRIMQKVDNLDEYVKKYNPMFTWSKGFTDKKGVYNFVKSILS